MVRSKFIKFTGLSTDVKPTGFGIPQGSQFVETDTLKKYTYSTYDSKWHETTKTVVNQNIATDEEVEKIINNIWSD